MGGRGPTWLQEPCLLPRLSGPDGSTVHPGLCLAVGWARSQLPGCCWVPVPAIEREMGEGHLTQQVARQSTPGAVEEPRGAPGGAGTAQKPGSERQRWS